MITGLHLFAPRRGDHGTGDDPLDILRLIRSRRVGPVTFHRLLAEHGSAAAALSELPAIARAAGVEGYEPCPPAVIRAEVATGKRAGARLIVWGSPNYPPTLAEIADAPPAFWVRGDPAVLSRQGVAVIGARNASSLGLRMARQIATELGEAGMIVTAGLARGIDTAAHEAAVRTGTIAVLAGGVDVVYPSENTALAHAIIENGALVSEQPPGTEPTARLFPARNRIISGLSTSVAVVEAALRSGSLITARNALDQGREVMAVPGHPLDARAGGCNALIRDGAALIRNAGDILAVLGHNVAPEPAAETRAPPPVLQPPHGDLAARILERLSTAPIDEDSLLRELGIPASAASAAILTLELENRARRVAGGGLALA